MMGIRNQTGRNGVSLRKTNSIVEYPSVWTTTNWSISPRRSCREKTGPIQLRPHCGRNSNEPRATHVVARGGAVPCRRRSHPRLVSGRDPQAKRSGRDSAEGAYRRQGTAPPQGLANSLNYYTTVSGLFLYISSSPAGACLLDVTGCKKIGQGTLDGGEADVRTSLGDFLLGNLARSAPDDGLDTLRF